MGGGSRFDIRPRRTRLRRELTTSGRTLERSDPTALAGQGDELFHRLEG